jgi:phage-related protein
LGKTLLDEFFIKIGLDGSDAKKGMKDITSTLQGGFSSITKIFTGFGAALTGAFSIGSAFSTWKEQAAELGGVSRRLKMSMEDVQGWTGAIGKFGGSAQDFEGTLRGLNGQLAKMATIGKSRTGTLLQSLGIDAGEIGRQRNALEVLEEISGVMEQMAPDEARGIGAALGLDASTIMLLQQGREGMRDLIREKKESAVYTQEDADAIKAYNVEMGKVKKGFMGIMGVLFRSVMPAFTIITKYVSQFVNSIRKHQTAIKVFFTMIAALVMGLLLPSIMAFFGALLSNPITWVVLALAGLAAVIEDLIVWIEGGDSALDKFWESLFGDRENAKKIFEDLKTQFYELTDVIADTAKGLVTFIKPIAGILVEIFGVLWRIIQPLIPVFLKLGKYIAFLFFAPIAAIDLLIAAMMELFQLATGGETLFGRLWEALTGDPDFIKNTWQSICDFFKQVWETAVKWVSDKWDWLKNTAIGVCEAIKGAISDLGSFIMSTIGSAIDWAIEKWNALKAMVSGGAFVNHDLTASYASAAIGGGSTTNNNSSNTSYNISVGSVYSNNPRSFVSGLVPQANGSYRG